MPCKNGRPLLYEQFLTNVVRTGMQDFIVPLPQSSEHAVIILSRLGIRAGLIYTHFFSNEPSARHVVDMVSADDGKCASLRLSSFFDAAHEYEPVMCDVAG